MPQRVNRGSAKATSKKAKKTTKKKSPKIKAGMVRLGIMTDGCYDACIELGKTTITNLFDQVNKDQRVPHNLDELEPGETLWMNGKEAKPTDVIKKDGSTVTSSFAVKGGT